MAGMIGGRERGHLFAGKSAEAVVVDTRIGNRQRDVLPAQHTRQLRRILVKPLERNDHVIL